MKKNNIFVFGMLASVLVLGFVFVACATGTNGDIGASSQLTVTNLPSGDIEVFVDVPLNSEGSFTVAESSTNSVSSPFSLVNKHDSAPFTGSGTYLVCVITGSEPNRQFRKKLDVIFTNGSATVNWNDMTPYTPG
jgi:hypothetical protein